MKHKKYIVNYLVSLAASFPHLCCFLLSLPGAAQYNFHTYSSEEKWVYLSFSLGAKINTVLSTCCPPPQAGPVIAVRKQTCLKVFFQCFQKAVDVI